MDIRDRICEYNPEAIMFDDLDDAILGIGKQHGSNSVIVYSKEKCISVFFKKFVDEEKNKLNRDLTDEESSDLYLLAIEWFSYNVECAYVGENTPIFVEEIDSDY